MKVDLRAMHAGCQSLQCALPNESAVRVHAHHVICCVSFQMSNAKKLKKIRLDFCCGV